MASFLVQLFIIILNPFTVQYCCSQDNRSAVVPTSWKNNISSTSMGSWTFDDGSTLRPIFVIYSFGQRNYTFGFFKNAAYSSFYLSIIKHPISTNSTFNFTNYSPVVLWCANKDHPVGENSSLEFTADGNLALKDTDGTLVWSTNTSGLSILRMRLEFGGNLRLLNGSDDEIWKSFDYPTDTWAPNQILRYGQRLTSSVSQFNFSSGFFYLSVTAKGIYAFNESYPQKPFHTLFQYNSQPSASFNFGIGYLIQLKTYVKYEPYGKDFQYMRHEPDGRLCVYQLVDGYKKTLVSNLFSDDGLITGQGMEKKRRSSLVRKLAIPISASLLFLISISGVWFIFVRIKKKAAQRRAGKDAGEEVTSQVEDRLINFPYNDLQAATRNFDFSSKLGQGGYGEVFEGTLNGIRIAVKRLRSSVREGRSDFKAEVETLGRIHHVNLVRLIGYCITSSERFLIYEYMCKGSLDKWIFNRDEGEGQTFPWTIRRNIITDIAKGLLYLHESCNPNIIHFDIKPQNILLDDEFRAKIADFGLAKFLERDQSQVQTRCKGTPGYMAPELWTGRNISAKIDVYSFGIVMLEIVCGRKNSSQSEEELLIDVVKKTVEESELPGLVDKQLGNLMESNMEEPVRMLEIAIRCLQSYNRRPSISMVLKFIEGSMPMEPITDYGFLTIQQLDINPPRPIVPATTPLLPDVLSGPRS